MKERRRGRVSFLRDVRGNIGPLMALLLVPLLGLVGLVAEIGYGNMVQRNQQHAADSAVLAAAANNDATIQTGTKTRYQVEADAVAARYDIGDAKVETLNKQLCPDETTLPGSCYKTTITRIVPIAFSRVVGFLGVTDSSGAQGMKVVSVALAKQPIIAEYYCAVALGTGNGALSMSGSSDGWENCNVRSNGQIKCTAIKFNHVVGPDTTSCSPAQVDVDITTDHYDDPYAASNFQAKIAADKPTTCATNINAIVWTGNFATICSTSIVKLTATLNIPPGKTLFIDGVEVDLNGYDLNATSENTIVFTNNAPWFNTSRNKVVCTVDPKKGTTVCGPGSDPPTVTVTGPPTTSSSHYAGFAIVDDPGMTAPPAYDPKGAKLKLNYNLLGTIYTPNRSLTFDGSINSSVGGYTCLAIVAKFISSNGGKFPNNPTQDCKTLGYNPPSTPPIRQALVQ